MLAATTDQPLAQVVLLAVGRDGQAGGRADVDAGVALDALRVREHRLHVAVEAAFDLARGLLGIEAQLDLDESFANRSRRSTCFIFARLAGL